MKTKWIRELIIGGALLVAFALWTLALCHIDVAAIGPRGSSVGFSALNGFFHRLIGVNMTLYTITDWLGLVPVAFGFGFAIMGLVQWIARRNILKVDSGILLLGGFYILVIGAYLLFESVVVNFRPVLISGYLEVSYPSSTTLLVMCVMPTAIMQIAPRIKNAIARKWVCGFLAAFTFFMVMGRILSGVHWITDIIGGALLSAGLVMLYHSLCRFAEKY